MGKYDEYEKILYGKKSTSQLSKNQNSINNLSARLAASGVDPNEALDKRNALEKFLNLKQDQNVIFDVFELLNRPQQALFAGWKNAQEGGDFWEGAKQGITGNADTQFKEILKNYGMEDREGKLDLADVLGFAGDVFLDPADLVPVAGFSKIGKSLDAGDNIFKAIRSADSASDIAFKGIGKGLKGTAKLADTGLEKVLKNLDEIKGVRAFDKAGNVLSDTAKIAYGNLDNSRSLLPDIINKADLGDNFARAEKGRLQSYKELKNSIQDVFKKSNASVNAILNKRSAENTANEVKRQLSTTFKQNEDKLKNFLTKKGKDINSIENLDEVGSDVSLFIESMMDRSIEKDELLDLIREGKVYKNKNGNQIIDELEKMKKQLPKELQDNLDLSIKVDDTGKISLGDGWNKKVLRDNGVRSFKDLDPKTSRIADYGNWYDKADLDKIEELRKDEDFRALINDMFGEIKDGDVIQFDGDSVKILSNFDTDPKGRYGSASDLHSKLQREVPLESRGKEYGYAGGGYYREINDTLNEGGQLTGEAKRIADNVESAVNAYKTTEPIGLTKYDRAKHIRKAFGLEELPNYGYKSLSPEDLQRTADELQTKIGQKFKVSEGFNSAAIGAGSSYFTDKDMYMKIRAADGTNMFIVNPNEREAILKKAQEYTLRSAGIEDVMTEFGPQPKLVLTVDIFDENGKKLATIGDNQVAKGANQILDEGFGTNFGRFGDNNTYLPHTLADRSMANTAKDTNVPILRGNTSQLSHRTRLGSIRENNNLYREAFTKGNVAPEQAEFFKKYPKLFEENFNKAFANKYFDGMTGLGKQHKIVSDTLINQTFGNRTDIENLQKSILEHRASGNKEALKKATDEYNKLVKDAPVKYLTEFDDAVPNNFTKLSTEQCNEIRNHLKRIRQAVGSDAEGYNQLLKVFDSSKGSIAVNDDVLRMLQVTINPKEKNAILKAYDKVLDLYKSTKTLSFTNSLNNFVGNSSNLYLSGINPMEQAKYMSQAVDISKNGERLYTALLSGAELSPKELDVANKWKAFLDTGFGSEEIALDLQDLPDFMKDIAKNGKTSKKVTAKDVATWLPKMNMRANTYVDNLNRITVMLKSMEDPSYLRRLGIEGATDAEKYRKAISKVMFDPSMMTDAERNIMKRIIPFYTYAKNNLVFQMDNLGRNGSRYNRLMKTIKNLQKNATNNNEEDMADYIKNNLYVPIPGIGKDGEYTVLRTQLPFGDLVDLADNPGEFLVNRTGPVIKSPVEFATNTNSFTGREIESFPGQRSSNIPFLTKKQEKALGDFTGLDVPIKTATRLFSGNPLSTITMTNSIDTDKLSRSYEQIEDLQNLMKQYEQKGYQFSTMSELKKANKNGTLANIDAIFAKYGVNSNNSSNNPYSDYEKILYGR